MAKAEAQYPLDGGYYAGDWIPQPFPALQPEEQQALLDEHPLFTGRCPACETPFPLTHPGASGTVATVVGGFRTETGLTS